jgi:hypothetical protein
MMTLLTHECIELTIYEYSPYSQKKINSSNIMYTYCIHTPLHSVLTSLGTQEQGCSLSSQISAVGDGFSGARPDPPSHEILAGCWTGLAKILGISPSIGAVCYAQADDPLDGSSPLSRANSPLWDRIISFFLFHFMLALYYYFLSTPFIVVSSYFLL